MFKLVIGKERIPDSEKKRAIEAKAEVEKNENKKNSLRSSTSKSENTRKDVKTPSIVHSNSNLDMEVDISTTTAVSEKARESLLSEIKREAKKHKL